MFHIECNCKTEKAKMEMHVLNLEQNLFEILHSNVPDVLTLIIRVRRQGLNNILFSQAH